MAEFNITAKTYAAEHYTNERQVIKRITTGELSGYQSQGIWYVRIEADKESAAPKVAFMSVLEYAQQEGIPVSRILEEIASGIRQGFHEKGIWYVGNKAEHIPPKRDRGMPAKFAFLILSVLTILVIGALIFERARTQDLASLQIEAQIFNKTGTSRPIARETFFLINKDLESVANDYIKDLAAPDHEIDVSVTGRDPSWLTLLSGSTALRNLLFDISYRSSNLNKWEFASNFTKSKVLWGPHVVQIAITDAEGKARFKSIQPQDYWVVGWTETSAGFGFWNHKVSLRKGSNTLLLNRGNAVYFK